MSNIIINIDNQRTTSLDMLVMITGDDILNLSPITAEVPTLLSTIPNGQITLDQIDGGRLYLIEASLSDLDIDPTTNKLKTSLDPKSNIYYSWIEFSATATDVTEGRIWSNLTNVDMVTLPLIMKGTLGKNNWHLGYKASVNDIRTDLVPNVVASGSSAIISCSNNREKIVAPNIKPAEYPTLEDYVQILSDNEAPLIIYSDHLDSRGFVEFRGSFKKTSQPSDTILELISQDNFQNKIVCTKQNLTDKIMKECDGGELKYTNDKGDTCSIKQNAQETDTPETGCFPLTKDERTMTNSVFRNILIGINEGYFEPDQNNYSTSFPFLTPFPKAGQGNQYAKVLFDNSNSYGFPYADSNLKVLVTSDIGLPLDLTIIDDNKAEGFSTEAELDIFANEPQTGTFDFGIGDGSESLGIIRLGECRYVPTDKGAYGGFLPTLNDWTKMEFTGTQDAFIWIKTPDQGLSAAAAPDVEATGCFQQKNANGDFVDITLKWNLTNNKLDWGANIRWKPGATSPAKPTTNSGAGNVAGNIGGPSTGSQANRRRRSSILVFLRNLLRGGN